MKLIHVLPKQPFYLVSQSPRRKWLLSCLPLSFQVLAPGEEPPADARRAPDALVLANAKAKISPYADAARGLFLGCDTMIVSSGRLLGKPRDRAQAREYLRHLSGRCHTVMSGVVLRDAQRGIRIGWVVQTRLWFHHLSPKLLTWYLDSGEWRGKAGAYGLQGLARRFMAKKHGSLTNVYGLPLNTLVQMLLVLRRRK